MSYSPSEHVSDCERSLERARLVAKHYPNAQLTDIRGRREWVDESAMPHANAFAIEVIDKGEKELMWSRFDVRFVPYHEIGEGEIRARVYARTWLPPSQHTLMEQISKRPDLKAAILALLKQDL